MKTNEEKTTIRDYRLKLLKSYGIQVMPSSENKYVFKIYRYGEHIGEVYCQGDKKLEQYLKDLIEMTRFISNYWWDHEGDMVPLVKAIATNYSDDTISTEDVQEYIKIRRGFLSSCCFSDDCQANCVVTWKCVHYMGLGVELIDMDKYIDELLWYFKPTWSNDETRQNSLSDFSMKFFADSESDYSEDCIINKLIMSVSTLWHELLNGFGDPLITYYCDSSELSESGKIQILLSQLQFKKSILENNMNYFNTLLAAYLEKAKLIGESFREDYEFFEEIIFWGYNNIDIDSIENQTTKALLVDLGIKLLEDTGQKVPESNSELMQAIIFKNYLN